MVRMKWISLSVLSVVMVACVSRQPQQSEYPTTGFLERLDPSLDELIDTSATAEIIAEGFDWVEGPLWVEREKMLLFSDVPTNTIYKWTEENGTEVYLQPSGYTDPKPSTSKEPGSNGLVLDPDGRLVLCQHGNRQVARMDAPLDQPQARYTPLAQHYEGKRFNSPNDAIYNQAGDLFLTDPPYGLPLQNDDDPSKEIPFNGVYKVSPGGEVRLLTDQITRPNGIAFFPGENELLVASSDPEAANWYIVDTTNGSAVPRLFYSVTDKRAGQKGLPDGLKIDKNGNVFASGPGGIWIFNRKGDVLGRFRLDEAASNVAFSADERTLYITNDMYVLRLKMR